MKLEQLNLEDDLELKLGSKKGEKKKSGLWDKVWKKNKLKLPRKVAVLFLTNNNEAIPMEVEVRNGFYNIRGKSYHERDDCIYTMTKQRIPLAIIPEWSLIPIGTKKWEDKTIREKFLEVQTHAMRGIRHAELVRMGEKDKPINVKVMILIGIALIIGVAVFMGFA